MDKMPLGLIDAISAFLDHRDSIDGLDSRFAVFIFLSNAGGNAIAKKSFEFYQNGRPRDELTIRDLEGGRQRDRGIRGRGGRGDSAGKGRKGE